LLRRRRTSPRRETPYNRSAGSRPIRFRRNVIIIARINSALGYSGLAVLFLMIAGCSAGPMPVPVQQAAMTDADLRDQPHVLLDEGSKTGIAIDPNAVELDRFEWRYSNFDGRLIVTPNYKIYTTSPREEFVEQLPLFFESALAHYSTYLGKLPRPKQRMETYLFSDRRQWAAKTRELLPHQANVFETLGRGGFATQGTAVLYYIDHPRSRSHRDTFSIAAHEGWHQYTQLAFRNSLPIWLEEGIATYMESFRVTRDGQPQFTPWMNRERWYALRTAVVQDRLIPLEDLLRRTPQSFLETGKNRLLVYYAQVWALTRFLAEGNDGLHREALEQVLQDAATGSLATRLSSSGARHQRRLSNATSRSGPWIILEYFNADLDEFERDYLRYVDQITGRGQR
jgi:hypothetical protein